MTWLKIVTTTPTIIITANEAVCQVTYGGSANWSELGRGDLEILIKSLKMYMFLTPQFYLWSFILR